MDNYESGVWSDFGRIPMLEAHWRGWAENATPEERAELLSSDKFQDSMSPALQTIVIEAIQDVQLGEVELEVATEEEMANLFGDVDDDTIEDDDTDLDAFYRDDTPTGNYVDQEGNEVTDAELVERAAEYRRQNEA